MKMDRFTGSIFHASVVLTKLAYANLLWLAFTMAGLLIFGFFPATIALITMIKKFSDKEDPAIFSEFWQIYKEEFISSNKIGLVIIVVLIIFYADLTFLKGESKEAIGLLYYPALIAHYLFLLTSCYALALHVMYTQKIVLLFKNAFLIAVLNPLTTLMIIVGTAAIILFSSYVPWLLLFYGGSLWTLLLLFAASLAVRNIERKSTG